MGCLMTIALTCPTGFPKVRKLCRYTNIHVMHAKKHSSIWLEHLLINRRRVQPVAIQGDLPNNFQPFLLPKLSRQFQADVAVALELLVAHPFHRADATASEPPAVLK